MEPLQARALATTLRFDPLLTFVVAGFVVQNIDPTDTIRRFTLGRRGRGRMKPNTEESVKPRMGCVNADQESIAGIYGPSSNGPVV